MSEGGVGVTASAFCGACGSGIDAAARFCRSCGADQAEFAELEPEVDPRPGTEVGLKGDRPAEPALEIGREAIPADLGGLRDALCERHGFVASQAPPGDSAFEPWEGGAIGVLSDLPLRVEAGARPDGAAPLIRVRLGLDDPEAVRDALGADCGLRLLTSTVGVEVLAAPEHCGKDADEALAYIEGLAQRAAAAMEPKRSTARSEGTRAFTVCGYPQWVQTPDTGDVEGVELRHFELRDGEAEWAELAVRLAPSADGAMLATGNWDEEAPFISLMGRIAMTRQDDDGRETRAILGSGVCTLTNRRLLAVVYARPDDDVLEGLTEGMKESGITFQDASGRDVNPFSTFSEEEKALQFIDKAGAVDKDGGGVVLALSAFPQAFTGVELEGGLLQRGLGIPMMHLTGSPFELTAVPFRVLDADSHTVKPRRGQIKEAVNAWWAMTAQADQ